MRRHPYYFIAACIASCKTTDQVEACEKMVNNITLCLFARELADLALQKKAELLITIYTPE
jgi:hypothetical protein